MASCAIGAAGCRGPGNPDLHVEEQTSPILGSVLWRHAYGDSSSQFARSVAVDSAGSGTITGEFRGSVDFGCGSLASVGAPDAFVAKLSPTGACEWSKVLGLNAASKFGRAVATDDNGDVVILGDFRGTIDLGCGPLSSNGSASDIFLARLSSSGACLWSSTFGDAASQNGRAVAIDPERNIIIAGEFFGDLDLGGGPLVSQGDSDVYVAKFSLGGAYQWARGYGDSLGQAATSVAVDASSNVIVTGTFHGQVAFDPDHVLPETDPAGTSMFLAKLDPAGTHQWSMVFTGSGARLPSSVKASSTGEVVVAGRFDQVLDGLGPTCPSLSSAGLFDIFLAKLSVAGDCMWRQSFGSGSDQSATALAIGPAQTIFLTGSTSGPFSFGGSPIAYSGGVDAILAKFNGDGANFGASSYGDGQDQSGQAIASDPSSNALLMVGYFSGTINVGSPPLVSGGATDIFAVKLAHACDGSNCTGCCDGDVCRTSALDACGTHGLGCTACDADKADNCTAGNCRCGAGPTCQAGQRCLGGACTCDGSSCPNGCCNGDSCTPSTFESCGSDGLACSACSPASADNCTDGRCGCGLGPACGGGQRCIGGQCRCDDIVCQSENGCCNGETCQKTNPLACGSSCTRCNPDLADTCSNGQCQCGTHAQCSAGQRCKTLPGDVAARCICDASTCPDGCCDANHICQRGADISACGAGGGACQTCPGTDVQCSGGTCQCNPGECGLPACHPCTCEDYGQCGTIDTCHACTCEDFHTCTCQDYGLCGDILTGCRDCSSGCGCLCCLGSECIVCADALPNGLKKASRSER